MPIRSLPRAVGDALTQMTETDGCRHPAAGMCEAGIGAQTAKPFTRNFRQFGLACASTCEGGDRDTRHYLRWLAFTPRREHATHAHTTFTPASRHSLSIWRPVTQQSFAHTIL
jgi:hypothetical protein